MNKTWTFRDSTPEEELERINTDLDFKLKQYESLKKLLNYIVNAR